MTITVFPSERHYQIAQANEVSHVSTPIALLETNIDSFLRETLAILSVSATTLALKGFICSTCDSDYSFSCNCGEY